MISNSPVKS